MVRSVSNEIQDEIPENYKGRFMDGQKLDMTALIKLFQEFCSENADILEIVEMDEMKEASALFWLSGLPTASGKRWSQCQARICPGA